jgi:catechol-2,3-dioxygenase
MTGWYGQVLGMTINHRSAAPAGAAGRRPFSAVAFIGNDEVHHRLALFEVPGVAGDPDKARHIRLQHIAFEYQTIDDLLGTYARLKSLGILPVMAADEGMGTSFYYVDPDQNNVEININNYGNEWTATEHMKNSPFGRALVDPDKMIAARKAGASPWALHERALAGEFVPEKSYDPRSQF